MKYSKPALRSLYNDNDMACVSGTSADYSSCSSGTHHGDEGCVDGEGAYYSCSTGSAVDVYDCELGIGVGTACGNGSSPS